MARQVVIVLALIALSVAGIATADQAPTSSPTTSPSPKSSPAPSKSSSPASSPKSSPVAPASSPTAAVPSVSEESPASAPDVDISSPPNPTVSDYDSGAPTPAGETDIGLADGPAAAPETEPNGASALGVSAIASLAAVAGFFAF